MIIRRFYMCTKNTACNIHDRLTAWFGKTSEATWEGRNLWSLFEKVEEAKEKELHRRYNKIFQINITQIGKKKTCLRVPD